MNDSPSVAHFVREDVPVYTAAELVEVSLGRFLAPANVAGDHTGGDYLRMGMNQRSSRLRSMIAKNDDHHVAAHPHQCHIAPVICLDDPLHFLHLHFPRLAVVTKGLYDDFMVAVSPHLQVDPFGKPAHITFRSQGGGSLVRHHAHLDRTVLFPDLLYDREAYFHFPDRTGNVHPGKGAEVPAASTGGSRSVFFSGR